MKNAVKILLFFLSISFLSCDITETTNSFDIVIPPGNESSVPDSVKKMYKMDAAKLAWEQMSKDSSALHTEVELPQSVLNSFYNALIHIYNFDHPSRNSVIGIHSFQYLSLINFLVYVDTTASWVSAWKNGQTLTGNNQIDNLLNKYKINLVKFPSSSYLPLASLRTEEPLNTTALSNKFEEIPGVIYAHPNGLAGDGSDIRIEELTYGFVKVSFSVGWGDCPAGCINRHFWNYLVFSDGRVEFAGETGSPLPEP